MQQAPALPTPEVSEEWLEASRPSRPLGASTWRFAVAQHFIMSAVFDPFFFDAQYLSWRFWPRATEGKRVCTQENLQDSRIPWAQWGVSPALPEALAAPPTKPKWQPVVVDAADEPSAVSTDDAREKLASIEAQLRSSSGLLMAEARGPARPPFACGVPSLIRARTR